MLLLSYFIQLLTWKNQSVIKVYFYEATNIGITEAVEISPHYWIFPLSQLADSHYD